MAIIEHVEATPAERAAYLKRSTAERRLPRPKSEGEEEIALTNEEVGEETDLSDGALRVPQGARAVRADGHRIRLRQAVVVLRFPR